MRGYEPRPGICEACGKEYLKRSSNQKYCPDCREEHDRISKAKSYNARKQRFREEKRCINCGAQDERTLAGRVLCEACKDKETVRRNKLSQAWREKGLCVWCGKPAAPGYKLCEACRGRSKERFEARKANHVCIYCGTQDEKTLSGYTMCENCLETHALNNAKCRDFHIAHRKCVQCGKPLPDGWYYVRCPVCYEKNSELARRLRDKHREERMEDSS